MDIARLHHLAVTWMFVLVGGALTIVAYLLNRFAPKRRRRLRRVVFLYGMYVAVFALALALSELRAATWAGRMHLTAELLEAFTIVGLGGIFTFDLVLPALKVEIVSITSDIAIGLAYIVTSISVMHAAGVDPSSVVATSAVVSGILALSLQTTLGNILGGVALQLDGSIHVGDWIALENGRSGKVKEIRWRHTVVETRDWDTIIVPNASLLASNITILGKRDGMPLQHRMWVYFNVDFRYPPQTVINVINDALGAAPIARVAAEPKAHAICMDFAKDNRDSFAYYAVRYWLTDIAVDDPTSSIVRTRVYAALKRAGIPLARPASQIFFTSADESEEVRRLERHKEKRGVAIRALDLFKSLTPDELALVIDHVHYAPFAAGETITKQGAVAHWLYILASGSVEIRTRLASGEAKAVATLESPNFFGEAGMMTGEPRGADVIAVSDVECYRLEKSGFETIIRERPEIAAVMSVVLAKRRMELVDAREGLDADTRKARESVEQERILGRIQGFFGLS